MIKACAGCGVPFEAKRPHAKYHSETCRKRGQRAPAKRVEATVVGLPAMPAAEVDGDLTKATRAKLTSVGREGTELGAAALLLARRADRVGSVETGSGLAALMREWRATLALAVEGGEEEHDVVARIQEQAALKLLQGGRRGA